MAADSPVKPDARSANGTPLFNRACAGCGKVSLVDRRRLKNRCLPCALRERNSTHGLSGHPLYMRLKNIEARCRYPSATNYKYYGGRGISVCREWLDDPRTFIRWAEENGYEPGLEVDGIDNDGNYEPNNCRLLDHRHNSQRRRGVKTTIEQASMVKALFRCGATVKEAAARSGVSYMSAWHIKSRPEVWSNA